MQFHVLSSGTYLSHFCLLKKKWGILISVTYDEGLEDVVSEVRKAIPILTEIQILDFLLETCSFLLFDTEEEMNFAYSHIVGDDGPTANNPYSDDKVRVYALTCDPSGQLLSENT